jgi:hypothetical protein
VIEIGVLTAMLVLLNQFALMKPLLAIFADTGAEIPVVELARDIGNT